MFVYLSDYGHVFCTLDFTVGKQSARKSSVQTVFDIFLLFILKYLASLHSKPLPQVLCYIKNNFIFMRTHAHCRWRSLVPTTPVDGRRFEWKKFL